MVQTGAKIQFGGLNGGFWRDWYHSPGDIVDPDQQTAGDDGDDEEGIGQERAHKGPIMGMSGWSVKAWEPDS